MVKINTLLGRENELEEIEQYFKAGASLVIVAPPNSGKMEILQNCKQLALDSNSFHLIFEDTTFALAIKTLFRQYHEKYGECLFLPEDLYTKQAMHERKTKGTVSWDKLKYKLFSLGIAQSVKTLIFSFDWREKRLIEKGQKGNKPIIFVDNLRKVTDGNTAIFLKLMKHCQVIAVLNSSHLNVKHLDLILSNFSYKIKLDSLALHVCRQIVKKGLERKNITFENSRIRRMFINQVSKNSEGLPGLIDKSLINASLIGHIDRENICSLVDNINVKYFSMFPILQIVLAFGAAFKMIGLALGDITLRIEGVVFGVLLFLTFLFKSKLEKEI